MNDILYDYLSKRLNEINFNNLSSSQGPVVTISRAEGCTCNSLAKKLANRLNEFPSEPKWEVISKEILYNSAMELKLQPEKIKSIFEAKNINFFDELLQSFISGDYNIEKKIIKTVVNVIHRFGYEGHKIIIGRAGNIICSDIPNSIHLRIDAPLNWRIERIEEIKKLSREETINFIIQTEKNRTSFRNSIKGEKDQSNDYDLTINQATFAEEDIIALIIIAMQLRGIIK